VQPVAQTLGKENEMIPSFTSSRNAALNKFDALRVRALRDLLITKIWRLENGPKIFSEHVTVKLQNKRFAGIQEIRIDQIVGTLSRESDFDKKFRPLKKHLRDRWARTLLLLHSDGWQPIVVHKVGECYYVEDGHHRVSVAQAVGMLFIEAEVWDHSHCRAPQESGSSRHRSARTYQEASCVNS
jgi:hypothetical protein